MTTPTNNSSENKQPAIKHYTITYNKHHHITFHLLQYITTINLSDQPYSIKKNKKQKKRNSNTSL